MSDLTASNCGCGSNSIFGGNGGGCSWIIWILLLSCVCGNNGGGCGFGGGFGGNGCGCDDNYSNNNSCEWLIWILLLSCFCGGNNNGSRCC